MNQNNLLCFFRKSFFYILLLLLCFHPICKASTVSKFFLETSSPKICTSRFTPLAELYKTKRCRQFSSRSTAFPLLHDYTYFQEKILKAKKFEIVLSDAEELKNELFKLRYKMIKELHPPEQYSSFSLNIDKGETDQYDAYSKFCALKKDGEIVGGGRLILGQKDKPATSFVAQEASQHFFEDFSYCHIPIENIAEVSRLYVLPEYRNEGAFLAVLKGRMTLCAQYRITHIFSRIRVPLGQKYGEYGINYTPVSYPYDNHGMKNTIVYFDQLSDLLEELRKKNPNLWEFVTDKGLLQFEEKKR